MDVTHTPTPWYVVDNESYLEINVPWRDSPEIVNQYCPTVATVPYEGNQGINGHANAAFIVKAVNAHESLVNVLKEAMTLGKAELKDTFGYVWYESAVAALAAAGEQV